MLALQLVGWFRSGPLLPSGGRVLGVLQAADGAAGLRDAGASCGAGGSSSEVHGDRPRAAVLERVPGMVRAAWREATVRDSGPARKYRGHRAVLSDAEERGDAGHHGAVHSGGDAGRADVLRWMVQLRFILHHLAMFAESRDSAGRNCVPDPPYGVARSSAGPQSCRDRLAEAPTDPWGGDEALPRSPHR